MFTTSNSEHLSTFSFFGKINNIHCHLCGFKEKFCITEKLTHFYCLFNMLLRVLSRSESFFFKDYFEAKLI